MREDPSTELLIQASDAYHAVVADPEGASSLVRELVARGSPCRGPPGAGGRLAGRGVVRAQPAGPRPRRSRSPTKRSARPGATTCSRNGARRSSPAARSATSWAGCRAAERDFAHAATFLGDGTDAELDSQLAALHQNSGRLDEAAAAYRRILARADTPPAVRTKAANNLGMIDVQCGRVESGLAWFDAAAASAVEVGPAVVAIVAEGRAWATVRAGRLADGLRQFDDAAELWAAANLPLGELHAELADALIDLRLIPEATREARRAVAMLDGRGVAPDGGGGPAAFGAARPARRRSGDRGRRRRRGGGASARAGSVELGGAGAGGRCRRPPGLPLRAARRPRDRPPGSRLVGAIGARRRSRRRLPHGRARRGRPRPPRSGPRVLEPSRPSWRPAHRCSCASRVGSRRRSRRPLTRSPQSCSATGGPGWPTSPRTAPRCPRPSCARWRPGTAPSSVASDWRPLPPAARRPTCWSGWSARGPPPWPSSTRRRWRASRSVSACCARSSRTSRSSAATGAPGSPSCWPARPPRRTASAGPRGGDRRPLAPPPDDARSPSCAGPSPAVCSSSTTCWTATSSPSSSARARPDS